MTTRLHDKQNYTTTNSNMKGNDMGMFSWHNTDTDEPIWNVYSGKNTTVYMIDDKGKSWAEDRYEGYGVFGGKDYYELLAEMNGLPSCRGEGISLAYSKPPKPHFAPNFVTSLDVDWRDVKSRDHDGQGYFDETAE